MEPKFKQDEEIYSSLEDKLGTFIASLADQLGEVQGGRYVLALVTGALNMIPVIGPMAVEFKNIYSLAATEEKVMNLTARVMKVQRIMEDHSEQLDQIFGMIEEISMSLIDYIGTVDNSTIKTLDAIAYPLISRRQEESDGCMDFDMLETLLREHQYEQLLDILGENSNVHPTRQLHFKIMALSGKKDYRNVCSLLKDQSIESLSPEELEIYILSCFETGDKEQGLHLLNDHLKKQSRTRFNFLMIGLKARFAKQFPELLDS